MIKNYVCLIILLAFSLAGCSNTAKTASLQVPPEQKRVDECADGDKSIFCDASHGVDMSGYTLQETMSKDWYAYEVNGNQGFNPFFVPFDYHCQSGTPDSMQRFTFPVLLSLKFDFVDNNICTRHPAFIYSRDEGTRQLMMTDMDSVIEKMEKWGQNVAIGGTLVQHGTKYSGTLKIINKSQVLLEKQFSNLGYFELMGEMVSSWMEFSGRKVTHSLKSELIRPMTSSGRAIYMLGQALELKARSDEQWMMYEKILQLYPDFAELRWWYANQKWWQTRDNKWEDAMMLTALESHLVLPALHEVEYSYSQDLTRRYAKVFERARKIIPDHWVVKSAAYSGRWDKMSRREALELSKGAMKMPYAYSFSNKVAKKCYDYSDFQASVLLMLSIINSRYNPGEGVLAEYARLVYSYQALGYLRDSTALLQPMFGFTENKETAALYAGWTLEEAMEFKQAIELYKMASGNGKNRTATVFLVNAYLDAGMTDEVRKIMSSDGWNVIPEILKPVFEGRLNQQAGNVGEAARLFNIANHNIKNNGYYRRFLETALVEKELAEGSPEVVQTMDRLWANSPRSRKTYHLFRKVHKKDSNKMAAYLYVATHIFPNQRYWRNEAEKYSHFPDADPEQLASSFTNLKMASKERGLNMSSGFQVENICLRLLTIDPQNHYDEVVGFYRNYANDDKNLSTNQKIHRRTFLTLLENSRRNLSNAQ